MRKTPLESWVAAKIKGARNSPLTQEELRGYQLARLQETCAYASEKSPFYRRRLEGFLCQGLESSRRPCRISVYDSPRHRQEQPPVPLRFPE